MNNICYCEAPWAGREIPKWMTDRAHVANADCNRRAIVKAPEWLARKDRGLLPAKELTR